VPFSIRDEALSGLRDWWSDRIDTSFFNQVCGYTLQADTRFTGLNAAVAPDSNHVAYSDSTALAEGSITTTATYTLTMIDKAVERARTLTPAIRPVNVNGRTFYVTFLHPYQVTDLRTSVTTGQWLDIQKAAMTGGEIEDNPIFDGSLGVYNGTILHSDVRVTQGVTSGALTANVRRAVFCGAQACMMAYGRDGGDEQYTWVEELFDYENELGVSAALIWGMKKSVFNSTDFATIVTSTYAVSH